MEPTRMPVFLPRAALSGALVEVPQHVDGDGRAAAGEAIDLAGVAEFFFDGRGGGGLVEFAEAGAGVGEAPEGISMRGSGRARGRFALFDGQPYVYSRSGGKAMMDRRDFVKVGCGGGWDDWRGGRRGCGCAFHRNVSGA